MNTPDNPGGPNVPLPLPFDEAAIARMANQFFAMPFSLSQATTPPGAPSSVAPIPMTQQPAMLSEPSITPLASAPQPISPFMNALNFDSVNFGAPNFGAPDS